MVLMNHIFHKKAKKSVESVGGWTQGAIWLLDFVSRWSRCAWNLMKRCSIGYAAVHIIIFAKVNKVSPTNKYSGDGLYIIYVVLCVRDKKSKWLSSDQFPRVISIMAKDQSLSVPSLHHIRHCLFVLQTWLKWAS